MQYIDDDMDEVFRRAADDYPLNTDSADWNEVLRKLSAGDPETTVVPANKKNYRGLLLLLLLLPATWIGYEYFNAGNYNPKKSIADKEVSKNIVSSSSKSSAAQLNKTTSEKITSQQPATPAALQPSPVVNQSFTNHNNKNNIYKQWGQLRSVQTAPQTSSVATEQSSASEDINKKEANPVLTNSENEKNTNPVTENNIETNTLSKGQDNDKKENNTLPATAKTKNQKQAKQSGIYAGILFSPDISTVKFQSIKKTGLTIGLVVGYQFNKKLSLETGVAWNKKHYYSNGDYFNTKNIVLPANAKITKLDGVCKMIEVPVTVRYNFRSSVKTNLSVSAGLSSYIMKNENYDYTIEHTGVQYPRSAAYKNSSTNLLAVADVGFGYNHSLGKGATLRLEPYLKIPITGVGIGQLPIMSTGMNIGITKKLSNK